MEATEGGYGTSQLPLAGAIICCTSIAPEQRAQLAAIGAQMGATIKLDLTSDVTHLVVGSTESAKYRYVAKSREDVKVLSPTWLEALREVWMDGDDNMDMAALETEHRLPTFFGHKICLTGFDDPQQRRHIQETVDSNGAEYHGDLTKAVTHLIAATPTGKKYDHALNWRMKIVSLEWFEQSLQRGMVLDEALYHPTLAVEERGKGAWDRREPSSPAMGKRPRDAEPSEALNPFRRKLRRSASTKMGTQSDALWAGITAANSERQQDYVDEWTEDQITAQANARQVTPATCAEDAVAPEDDAPANPDPAYTHALPGALSPDNDYGEGLFQGRVIILNGFDKDRTNILRTHLGSHGGRLSQSSDLNTFSSNDLKRGYLMVPHDAQVDLTSLPECAGSMNLVTNWWAERCLFGKSLVDPAEYTLGRPLGAQSIRGFSGLTVHSTGFVGIELLHVTKAVTLMGAAYDEEMSVKVSVIICNDYGTNQQKIKFATDRRIPAVRKTWLWACLRTGGLQPYSDFQLNTFAHQPQTSKPKPKPRSSTEAPLEKSSGLQQRKAQAVVKVPKPRGPAHPRALNLVPSANTTPATTSAPQTRPNISTNNSPDDCDIAIPGYDGHASLPLQDISANSPRRPSTSSNELKPITRNRSSSAESLIRPPRKSKDANHPPHEQAPGSVIPADTAPAVPEAGPTDEKDYSDILAQLRANRKPVPSPADPNSSTRRRGRRQLGRAASTRSNGSSANGSGRLNLDDTDEQEKAQEYQPSQELGWDTPGAAKAREQMIKRLGGRVEEKSVRVEGIGVVRDVASEATGGSIGGRASRKKRAL